MTNQHAVPFELRLRGRVIQPGDAEYDTGRAVYNGMIHTRPG